MKYLKDLNDLTIIFPKYLLIHEDQFTAIAYLLRDMLNESGTKITTNNSAIIVGLFQDVFDTMNPLLNDDFSAFDLEYDDGGFEITFMYSRFFEDDFDQISAVNKIVRVEY